MKKSPYMTQRVITKIGGILLAFAGIFGIAKVHILYPGLNCYACPLSVTVCPMGIIQTFVTSGSIPYLAIAYMSLFGLSLGRGWCGWVCPFGTVQDIINGKKRKHSAWFIKYSILIGFILLAWYFADTLFCKICPQGTLEGTIPYLFNGVAKLNITSLLHIISLIVVIALTFLISRFWCRYLCPVGAMLGLFNKITPFGMKFEKEKCTDCGLCTKNCPQGLDVPKQINSSDCIKCGKCSKCSAITLQYKVRKKSAPVK